MSRLEPRDTRRLVEIGLRGAGEMSGSRHHSNDDKSPLTGLLNCIVCKETMKIERSEPDTEGKDIIQYRCEQCGRIERVRLFRRSRDTG
jgi:hypothetical protein